MSPDPSPEGLLLVKLEPHEVLLFNRCYGLWHGRIAKRTSRRGANCVKLLQLGKGFQKLLFDGGPVQPSFKRSAPWFAILPRRSSPISLTSSRLRRVHSAAESRLCLTTT